MMMMMMILICIIDSKQAYLREIFALLVASLSFRKWLSYTCTMKITNNLNIYLNIMFYMFDW